MKLSPPQTAAQLGQLINAHVVGNTERLVTGLNEINRVEEGDLVFVDHEKYYDKALNSAATTILINKAVEPPAGKALLISDDPCRDYNALMRRFMPRAGWAETG
ncbi:MAG: LpxD N-terminal domain-containing protein, partial [Flavobacteriales bacterium]